MNFIQKHHLYKRIMKLQPSKVNKTSDTFLWYKIGVFSVSCAYNKNNKKYTTYVEYPRNIVDFNGILGRKLFKRTERFL